MKEHPNRGVRTGSTGKREVTLPLSNSKYAQVLSAMLAHIAARLAPTASRSSLECFLSWLYQIVLRIRCV
jgi:hypothetical protein